ncbi:caspase domain-containing protein [Flammula alnicola]|nr:caspase domain-containing protein [Flammula alnicola]
MWNNNQQSSYGGAPPAFPSFPSADNNIGIPNPQPGYNPGYAPSYGPPPGAPPSGYGAPPSGFGFPPGPPPSGYGPPPGPPHSSYGPPPGLLLLGMDSCRAPAIGLQPSSWTSIGERIPRTTVSPATFPRRISWPTSHSQGGYPAQHHPPPHGGNAYRPPPGPPPPPPTQVQNYGPHFEGANHKDAQPYFQYSQCNGKKKALYWNQLLGQTGELAGCINDANNIQNFLITQYGYKREDILQAMQWLVRGAQPNDSLFFHYSGHGGQTKDLDGDEADGYDEVIYPMDYEANGHIVDDLIHDIMIKPLPAGCRMTGIFDSCHSGSAMDLPYIYSTEGKVKEPNLAAEAGQGLLSAVTSYARGDMGGVFKSAMGLVKTATGNTQKAEKVARATKTSPADCISWSGCKDSQTSADTQEAGTATGAMSFAFISALSTNKQQSYQQLLISIREILRAKYSQKPQLSSSHPMDTNIMFIC